MDKLMLLKKLSLTGLTLALLALAPAQLWAANVNPGSDLFDNHPGDG